MQGEHQRQLLSSQLNKIPDRTPPPPLSSLFSVCWQSSNQRHFAPILERKKSILLHKSQDWNTFMLFLYELIHMIPELVQLDYCIRQRGWKNLRCQLTDWLIDWLAGWLVLLIRWLVIMMVSWSRVGRRRERTNRRTCAQIFPPSPRGWAWPGRTGSNWTAHPARPDRQDGGSNFQSSTTRVWFVYYSRTRAVTETPSLQYSTPQHTEHAVPPSLLRETKERRGQCRERATPHLSRLSWAFAGSLRERSGG